MSLRHDYIPAPQSYEKYPFIKSITRDYENELYHSYTASYVKSFELYKSQDNTRILLIAYLSRKRFNYIEFIIDAKSNKLLWHNTCSCHSDSFVIEIKSYRNIFLKSTFDAFFGGDNYELVGTNYSKRVYSKKDIHLKILFKIYRLIKLVDI